MGEQEHTLAVRCLDFFDNHPRTGWYLAITAGLNVLLNLLDLVV